MNIKLLLVIVFLLAAAASAQVPVPTDRSTPVQSTYGFVTDARACFMEIQSLREILGRSEKSATASPLVPPTNTQVIAGLNKLLALNERGTILVMKKPEMVTQYKQMVTVMKTLVKCRTF